MKQQNDCWMCAPIPPLTAHIWIYMHISSTSLFFIFTLTMNAMLVTHFTDQGKQMRTIDQHVLAFSETISYDSVGFLVLRSLSNLLLLTIAVECAESKEERFYFVKLLKHKKTVNTQWSLH